MRTAQYWLLAAVVAAAPGVHASPQSELKAAIRLYDEFRPEDAARALRPLTVSAPAPVRAKAWLYLGLSLGTVADEAGARAAFRQAFLLERSMPVPDAAPELKMLAEAERALARAELEAVAEAKKQAEAEARALAEAERTARAEEAARVKAEAEAKVREAAEAKARAAAAARAEKEAKAREAAEARALAAEVKAREAAEAKERLKAEEAAKARAAAEMREQIERLDRAAARARTALDGLTAGLPPGASPPPPLISPPPMVESRTTTVQAPATPPDKAGSPPPLVESRTTTGQVQAPPPVSVVPPLASAPAVTPAKEFVPVSLAGLDPAFETARTNGSGVLELAPSSAWGELPAEDRERAIASAWAKWSQLSQAGTGLVLVHGREEQSLFFAGEGSTTLLESWGPKAPLPTPRLPMFVSGGVSLSTDPGLDTLGMTGSLSFGTFLLNRSLDVSVSSQLAMGAGSDLTLVLNLAAGARWHLRVVRKLDFSFGGQLGYQLSIDPPATDPFTVSAIGGVGYVLAENPWQTIDVYAIASLAGTVTTGLGYTTTF